MNKINKITYLIIFSLIGSSTLFAQRANEEVEREVIMLREYNPVLDDAEKINVEPKILSIDKKRHNPVFIEKAPFMNLSSNNIGYLSPGTANTKIDFDNQVGYIGLGAGNYGNIIGNGGLRVKAGNDGLFDLWGRYSASNGDITYTNYDVMKLLSDKAKSKYQNIDLHTKYKLENNLNSFEVGLNFENLGFNYYGAPVGFENFNDNFPHTQEDKQNLLKWFDQSTMQRITFLDFYATICSKKTPINQEFIYNGGINYKYFNASKGYQPSLSNGPNGGIASANFGVAKSVLEGYAGADFNILYQYFSDRDTYKPANNYPTNYYGNYFNLGVNPYYFYEDLNWNLKVGANLNYLNYDSSNKILLTPNIKFNLKFNEVNTFYINLLGGIKNNTFAEVISENKYVDLYNNVKYSKTPFDGQLGVKIGSIEGVEIDLFGGYKEEKNAHYFLTTNSVENPDFLFTGNPTSTFWGNNGMVKYYKYLNTASFGIQVETSLIPYTKLLIRGTGYHYNACTEYAYNKPTFETLMTANITPIDNLVIGITYLLQSGRKGIFQKYYLTESNLSEKKSIYQKYDMKNINELDISVEYRIIKQLSIFANINNLFNAKYDIQPGYTLQGTNLLGGFNLKF